MDSKLGLICVPNFHFVNFNWCNSSMEEVETF
jgi:hypothetical protein